MATRSADSVRKDMSPDRGVSPDRNVSQDRSAAALDDDLLAADPFDDHQGPGRWRWFFSGIWLVYLIQPVADLFGDGHGVLWTAGGLLITIAFCGLYLPVLMFTDTHPRQSGYGLAGLAVLASVACLIYGSGWTSLWIYVSAAAGMVLTSLLDRRRASLAIFGIAALYLLFCWITHLDLGDSLGILLPVLLIGLAMIGFRLQIALMHELRQARDTVARLAANEERLRLARDMHDLTGQSLSMITLKSELAAKRLAKLPASAERDSVLTELGDIGRVSRQTLQDIREAVSGYRRPTLAIEVITARHALEAAGIELDDDAELTLRSGSFDPEAEAVLAWCLREAVTNVIRHSRATRCRIRLATRPGLLFLDVTDDGQGFSGLDPDHPAGSGLHGMSERLSAAGGRLSLGPADGPGSRTPGRGFRLTAIVPAELPAPSPEAPSPDVPSPDATGPAAIPGTGHTWQL
jgi:two-component system sensor histidine kinase DesK